MYYGKKKIIIISIVVAVIVIALVLTGIILVTKTDMFKSNKTLFWKYLFSMPKDEGFTLSQLTDAEKMMEENPYTINGEMTFGSDDSDLNTMFSLAKILIKGEKDYQNQYSHVNTTVDLSNEDFFKLDYVQAGNIYALNSDDIVTAYVGIKNENLKVLAQKLGLNTLQYIPNEFTETQVDNYAEALEISDEEMEHISQTYQSIIMDNIPDSNYTKQTQAVIKNNGVSYTTTAYRLDLTAEEVRALSVKLLETLKTDSITLNMISSKAKLLGIDENYSSLEGITNLVDEAIQNIDQIEFNDISIVVYSYKNENIATEVLLKNDQKYTIYKGVGSLKIKQEDLTGENSASSVIFDIEYKTTTTQTSAVIRITMDDLDVLNINISNSGSAQQGSLKTDIIASIVTSEDAEAINVEYNQEIEFVDEIQNKITLDSTNCAVLNDYSTEDLQGLMQAIIERIQVVITEKSQIIDNLVSNNVAMQRAIQNIENRNNTSVTDNVIEERQRYNNEMQEEEQALDEAMTSFNSLMNE